VAPDLPSDGSWDGVYSLLIIAQDRLGSVSVDTVQFSYDTKPPDLTNLFTDVDESVNLVYYDIEENVYGFSQPVSQVVAVMNDADTTEVFGYWDGSGVALGDSTSLLYVIYEPDDSLMVGNQSASGDSARRFIFANPTEQVGLYRLEIEPEDKAGNIPPLPQVHGFFFDDEAPVATSFYPDQQYVNWRLTSVSAVVSDQNGIGIDANNTNLTFYKKIDDVYQPLAGDSGQEGDSLWIELDPELGIEGSDDGEYKIGAQIHDLLGNTANDSLPFIFDTQAPGVVSIFANGDNTNNLIYEDAEIPGILEELAITYNDADETIDFAGSGVDTDNSMIMFFRIAGTELDTISMGLYHAVGNTQIWRPNEYVAINDFYLLYVFPVDIAGNIGIDQYPLTILADSDFPYVTELCIRAAAEHADSVCILEDDGAQVLFEARDFLISFDDITTWVDSVYIILTYPDDEIVHFDEDAIDWIDLNTVAVGVTLGINGTYELDVRLRDYAGNISNIHRTFQYNYDQTAPNVTVITPDIDQPAVERLLWEIKARIDDGTGVGVDFEESQIVLKTHVPDDLAEGDPIAGQKVIAANESAIIWQLDEPILVNDWYTIEVSAFDQNDNRNTILQEIHYVYDAEVSIVQQTYPSSATPVYSEIEYISVTVQDVGSSGQGGVGPDLSEEPQHKDISARLQEPWLGKGTIGDFSLPDGFAINADWRVTILEDGPEAAFTVVSSDNITLVESGTTGTSFTSDEYEIAFIITDGDTSFDAGDAFFFRTEQKGSDIIRITGPNGELEGHRIDQDLGGRAVKINKTLTLGRTSNDPEKSPRSIEGSTIETGSGYIPPGSSGILVFRVTNRSPDEEWIRKIDMYFPTGVIVDTSTHYMGGTGGPLEYNGAVGSGAHLIWEDQEPINGGNIRQGQSAIAQISVIVSSGFTGDNGDGIIHVPYEIYGDDGGLVTGQVNIGPTDVGGETMIYQLDQPLSGADDYGDYVIWVRPVDLNGNVGSLQQFPFYYNNRWPDYAGTAVLDDDNLYKNGDMILFATV
ncbi:MAG: hypothetical protein GY869_00330, partial [Planctomycetes bacterium]|nr:hypothetical protein [Planctomycetota bacterium]